MYLYIYIYIYTHTYSSIYYIIHTSKLYVFRYTIIIKYERVILFIATFRFVKVVSVYRKCQKIVSKVLCLITVIRRNFIVCSIIRVWNIDINYFLICILYRMIMLITFFMFKLCIFS